MRGIDTIKILIYYNRIYYNRKREIYYKDINIL